MEKFENEIKNIDDYICKIKEECIKNLLNKFLIADDKTEENYHNYIGVYALFLKKNIENVIDDFIFIDGKAKEDLRKKCEEAKNKNLLYIGKTCRSFKDRVFGETGHKQAGNTSVSGKLYKYMTGNKTKDYYNLPKDKGNEYRKQIREWFKENIEIKIFPVADKKNKDKNNNKIIVTLIEEILIKEYNPPLNKI